MEKSTTKKKALHKYLRRAITILLALFVLNMSWNISTTYGDKDSVLLVEENEGNPIIGTITVEAAGGLIHSYKIPETKLYALTQKSSLGISAQKGDRISIIFTTSSNLKCGLLRVSDNEYTYNTVNGNAVFSYVVPKTDSYKIKFKNSTLKTVTVSGQMHQSRY